LEDQLAPQEMLEDRDLLDPLAQPDNLDRLGHRVIGGLREIRVLRGQLVHQDLQDFLERQDRMVDLVPLVQLDHLDPEDLRDLQASEANQGDPELRVLLVQ